jgi:beta-N-acetylhexosaminidase
MMQRDRRRQVGQLMLAGFRGHTVPVELRSLARDFDLGGVVLFSRNVAEPGQVADLAREVQALAGDLPLWVAIDQEGGRVQRVKAPLTRWPAPAALGRADDLDLTRRFGRALSRELRAMGITFNFVPVLDVLTRTDNPAIGDRALSDAPDVVARHGVALIEAVHAEGLPACAKHFPGHGEASVDSHEEMPVVDVPPDRFDHVEWVPFRAAFAAGLDAVMSCHVLVPSLDDRQPATLSREILTNRLRGRLGFGGLVFSDDMDMKAISLAMEPGEAAARAVAAGCDVLLQCGGDPDRLAAALEGLVRAIEDDALSVTRFDDALQRHAALKVRYLSDDARRRAPVPPTLRDVIGSAEHALVAEQMRQFA